MSGTAAAEYGSEEPQCYNCGAQGHWAIACPEPTRQTPAGLAAWRNSSNTRPGSGNGGNRDRRGHPKKHKGPIITKYSPPLGLPSQPPPPPMSSYPPSIPSFHAPAPYSSTGPVPPPGPHSYQHYPHPPGYPAQPPSDYPPRHHIEPHYPPTPPGPPPGLPRPPPYGYDAQPPPHAYFHQPPPPPHQPHYGPSPPGYHAYPETGQEPQRFGPPPVPPPSYGSPPPPILSYGHSRGNSHGHLPEPPGRPHHRSNQQSDRHRAQPPHASSSRTNPGLSKRKPSISSTPIHLPTPLIHSLPPKPPQSRHAQAESQRGGKNVKKDRKSRQRGNKQRDGSKTKDQERKRPETPPGADTKDRPQSRWSNVSAENQEREEMGPAAAESTNRQEESPQIKDAPLLLNAPNVEPDRHPATDDEKEDPPRQTDGEVEEGEDWDWEFAEIFREPEAKNAPDEVGQPLTFAYHEKVLLPRKWDASCVVSQFVTPTNLKRYILPVHETEYWSCIEFDPAFVVDGRFPCGEGIPKHLRTGEMPPNMKREKVESPGRRNSKDGLRKSPVQERSAQEDRELDKRGVKRRHSSDARKKDSYIPSYRNQSRSRDRRSASRDSRPRSRRSSASSLNSLEAALLGISEDPKSPGAGRSPSPPPTYRRDDSSRSPQVKRKRPRTESAYSRRW